MTRVMTFAAFVLNVIVCVCVITVRTAISRVSSMDTVRSAASCPIYQSLRKVSIDFLRHTMLCTRLSMTGTSTEPGTVLVVLFSSFRDMYLGFCVAMRGKGQLHARSKIDANVRLPRSVP